MNCPNLEKIVIAHRQYMTKGGNKNPARHIVLQTAITEGQAMKISKFFRFLRPYPDGQTHPDPAECQTHPDKD